MKTCMKLMIVGTLGGALLVGCGGDDDVVVPDGGTALVGVRESIFYIDEDTSARAELPTPDINGEVSMPGTPPNGDGADRACALAATNIRPVETTPDIAVVMTVADFQTDAPVDNVRVQFYRDNLFPDPVGGTFLCEAGCQMGTSGPDGTVSPFMDSSDSWYAYFIKGRMGPTSATTPVDTAQYNEAAGAAVTGNSVSASTLAVIPTVLGLMRQSGTALVAGTFYDCNDRPVRGLVVRLFAEGADNTVATDDTFIPEGTRRDQPGYRYFNGSSFPSGGQPYTNIDGLFAAGNIPVAAPIRIEAWYNAGTAAAPDPQLWGCERIRVFPDGVTIVNVRPTRSDITGCTPAP